MSTPGLVWYGQLALGANAAAVVGVVCVVSAIGITLGSLRVRGVSLGVAGVLFAGILYAHFFWSDQFLRHLWTSGPGIQVSAETVALTLDPILHTRIQAMEFLRDFGLVLFVYSVGMQIGPNFFTSLRSEGLRWNLLAVVTVGMGLLTACVVMRVGNIHPAAIVGVLSGAVTNTPGLAAAQQALKGIPGIEASHRSMTGIGYAVAYPFGVIGTILTMMLVRMIFRVDVAAEARNCQSAEPSKSVSPTSGGLVKRVGLVALRFRKLFVQQSEPVFAGRYIRGWVSLPPNSEYTGSGSLSSMSSLSQELTPRSISVSNGFAYDRGEIPDESKKFGMKRLVVTNDAVIGKTLEQLRFHGEHGVNIARVVRGGAEKEPGAAFDLRYGDTLIAIGDVNGLAAVERIVGNSAKKLETPQLVPMFIAIAVGVVLGAIPAWISGLPAPIRLGLSGGPLLAALFFSSIGHVGRVNFYLPPSANAMLREFGIVLFLATTGLMAGGQFLQTLQQGDGWYWMGAGAVITVVPILTVSLFARGILRVNYPSLCGILAGSMTDAPALAFATSVCQSEGPSMAYGTVYPLTQILRVLSAQVFVSVFAVATL